jgi:hypothetical protein
MTRALRLLLGITVAAVVGGVVVLAGSVHRQHRDRASTPAARRSAVAVVRGPRGPRGRRGPRGPRGAVGRRGPRGSDRVLNLTINWRGDAAAPGRDTASVNIGGIGRLKAVCTPQAQTLTLVPTRGDVRTTANVSDFEGSAASNQQPYTEGGTPLLIGSPTQPGGALPPNGMIFATLSVEPISGNGGPGPSPATVTVSSEYKVNDPDPADDDCFIAAQVVTGG